MMRLAWQARPDGIVLVTDAVAWRAGTAGTIGLEVRDGAPRLPDGTLAGSVVTMIEAIRRSVHECGATLEQALAAASSRPAHLLGLHDRGVIAPGRRADLVALDADLDVIRTWVLGTPISDGGGSSPPG
jgi:N-acetylglucosamine-6-phosphate deacetylase